MVKFYLVGGAVRDKLLGSKSKDLDYSVEAPSFDAMRQEIVKRGGDIFLETPQYLTIRARVPNLGAADFVLCRKDGAYSDGRRPDEVIPGTLADDLARRDFTMNAIAQDEEGNLIDPHNGQKDIVEKTIRCVGSPYKRFQEDYLRMLRAIRFSVTKEFGIEQETSWAIHDLKDNAGKVSVERIREELYKAFMYDTPKTLNALSHYGLLQVLFNNSLGLKLKPTLEQ